MYLIFLKSLCRSWKWGSGSNDDTKWSSRLEWNPLLAHRGQRLRDLIRVVARSCGIVFYFRPHHSSVVSVSRPADVCSCRPVHTHWLTGQLGAIWGTANWPRPQPRPKALLWRAKHWKKKKVPFISLWFCFCNPKGPSSNIPFFWPASQYSQPD